MNSTLRNVLALLIILSGISCRPTGPLPPRLDRLDYNRVEQPRRALNFAGDWEKNYGLSDNFETKFEQLVQDIQQKIERLERNNDRNSSFNVNTVIPSRDAVLGLARFAEELTRMPLLHIEQDGTRVKIEREDDFALQCRMLGQQLSETVNSFGTETCSWDRGQMFLQIRLQNGLTIGYKVTMSNDGQELNVTTTVMSSAVDIPLTISNYYDRYTPPESDFDCVQTLSRNDVCTRSRN